MIDNAAVCQVVNGDRDLSPRDETNTSHTLGAKNLRRTCTPASGLFCDGGGADSASAAAPLPEIGLQLDILASSLEAGCCGLDWTCNLRQHTYYHVAPFLSEASPWAHSDFELPAEPNFGR